LRSVNGNPEVIRRGRTLALSRWTGITGEIQNPPHEIEVAKSLAADSIRQPYVSGNLTIQLTSSHPNKQKMNEERYMGYGE